MKYQSMLEGHLVLYNYTFKRIKILALALSEFETAAMMGKTFLKNPKNCTCFGMTLPKVICKQGCLCQAFTLMQGSAYILKH